MVVVHRKQQKYGPGATANPKERTCSACKEIFKSKLGLKNHHSRVSSPGCHRAGILRKRAEYVNERKSSGSTKKGLITGHESVYQKPKNKAFTAELKQICLNVYQKLRDKGIGVYEVHNDSFTIFRQKLKLDLTVNSFVAFENT